MGIKYNPLLFAGFQFFNDAGAPYYNLPVATEADLPVPDVDGSVRAVLATGHLYIYTNVDNAWHDISALYLEGNVGNTPNADGATLSEAGNADSVMQQILQLQPADATHPGVLTEVAQDIGGNKTFKNDAIVEGSVLSNTIDARSATSMSIGATNATVINIGNAGSTVNIQGTTLYENVTQLQVVDPLITLNKNAGAGSAAGSGIELEEGGSITAYLKSSADRNSWEMKAPNTDGIIKFTPTTAAFSSVLASSVLTATRTYTLPDITGSFVLTEGTQTVNGNKTLSGTINLSNLTASTPLKLDGLKNIISSDIDLTTDVTGTLPVANGGTNSTSYSSGSVIFSNGTALTENNSKLFWDNTNYSLGLGTSAPETGSGGAGAPTIHMKGQGPSWSVMESYVNGATASSTIQARHARGTVDAPTASTSGDTMFFLGVKGYGTTGFSGGSKASVEMWASETWSDTAQGTKLMFGTTANTTTSRLRRFSIDNDGKIGIHDPSSQNNILGIYAPTGLTPYNITLPSAQGAANTLMKNNGSGTLSWAKADLTTDVTGVLPVANGGTNSSTALNNSRIMQSSGGAIVEAAAITASRALVSDANGIPTHATTTATEIGYVNGVTSAIQTQLNNKQPLDATLTALAAYNTNGILTQTAADTFAGRTITAGNGISVADGNGVAGNPTITATNFTSGDIVLTSFSGANNQAVAADVTGLAFANGSIRAFNAIVSVTVIATSSLYEVFNLTGIQRGADWIMSASSVGDVSGVTFSITNAGQVQYQSTNNAGFTSLTMKFRAEVTTA